MKSQIILIIGFCFTALSCAQEYEFINQNVKPAIVSGFAEDSVFLNDKFITLEYDFLQDKESLKGTLKMNWNPISNKPPIELFFKNFSAESIVEKYNDVKKESDSIIDFNQLNSYFKSSDKNYQKLNRRNRYLSISKPIFNETKDWAIMIRSIFMPDGSVGGGGKMCIYMKVEDKWLLYHEFTLWRS